MIKTRYVIYDDLRLLGRYKTLREAFDSGYIKGNRTYFYKAYSEEHSFIRDNIALFDYRDLEGRCMFLSNIIARRVKSSPDLVGLNRLLTAVVREISRNNLNL